MGGINTVLELFQAAPGERCSPQGICKPKIRENLGPEFQVPEQQEGLMLAEKQVWD